MFNSAFIFNINKIKLTFIGTDKNKFNPFDYLIRLKY